MTLQETRQDTMHPRTSENCYRLVYRSHSLLAHSPPGPRPHVPDGEESGLSNILRVARDNNSRHGVTGALVLYDDWFAQVLEGPEAAVTSLFDRIRTDPRHNGVTLDSAETVGLRLFDRWAMAIVADHGEPDLPIVATSGGLSEAAPWRVNPAQEAVLTRLRDLTRGYGKGS